MQKVPGLSSPLMLGFDHFERMLVQASKMSAEGYPPYNIEQVGKHGLRITLAVAGFCMDGLSVSTEDNQLVIRGRNTDNDSDKIFLHRGIAARQFHRSFVLAEGIKITAATSDNGLLHIDLERQVPEPEIRTIKIKSGKASGSRTQKAKTIHVDHNDTQRKN